MKVINVHQTLARHRRSPRLTCQLAAEVPLMGSHQPPPADGDLFQQWPSCSLTALPACCHNDEKAMPCLGADGLFPKNWVLARENRWNWYLRAGRCSTPAATLWGEAQNPPTLCSCTDYPDTSRALVPSPPQCAPRESSCSGHTSIF